MTSCLKSFDPLTSDCQKKTTMISEGERGAAFTLAEEGGLTLTPFLVYLLEKVGHWHFLYMKPGPDSVLDGPWFLFYQYKKVRDFLSIFLFQSPPPSPPTHSDRPTSSWSVLTLETGGLLRTHMGL
jgi:hypothetical protein